MITKPTEMSEPPSDPADFMTDFDVRYCVDVTLARGLTAVLPQIMEYLDTDDSRDVLKELTHDTRNVDKELGDDSRNINKELVDDSQNVHKDRAPRTVEWGNTIEVTPVASGSKPQYSGPSSPQQEPQPS